MAITWEALLRLISNLEKAHPQGPSNIPGKFQLDRTSGCRETAFIDTDTDRQTDRQTDTHTLLELYIDRLFVILHRLRWDQKQYISLYFKKLWTSYDKTWWMNWLGDENKPRRFWLRPGSASGLSVGYKM